MWLLMSHVFREYKTKFLCVYIDSVLSWRDHIQYIEGKVARALGIVIKARNVFHAETLKHCIIHFFIHILVIV